jgi:hypothetical protein
MTLNNKYNVKDGIIDIKTNIEYVKGSIQDDAKEVAKDIIGEFDDRYDLVMWCFAAQGGKVATGEVGGKQTWY